VRRSTPAAGAGRVAASRRTIWGWADRAGSNRLRGAARRARQAA
jgi:hypothetical protein